MPIKSVYNRKELTVIIYPSGFFLVLFYDHKYRHTGLEISWYVAIYKSRELIIPVWSDWDGFSSIRDSVSFTKFSMRQHSYQFKLALLVFTKFISLFLSFQYTNTQTPWFCMGLWTVRTAYTQVYWPLPSLLCTNCSRHWILHPQLSVTPSRSLCTNSCRYAMVNLKREFSFDFLA